MSRTHIHKTSWQLPEKFAKPMQVVQQAVNDLKASAGHDFLKFTLDGRLVGDLGEAIAEHFFDITLHNSQKTGHDATLLLNGVVRSVEIKIRRNSSNIWFNSEPDYIIAFRLEKGDARITLVYAGPGSVLRDIRPGAQHGETDKSKAGKPIRKFTKRQEVSLNQLAKDFNYEAFMKKPSIPIRNQPTVAS